MTVQGREAGRVGVGSGSGSVSLLKGEESLPSETVSEQGNF